MPTAVDADAGGSRVVRERFLSQFALALGEEREFQKLLDWAVDEAGRILGVDRLTLFLFKGPATAGEMLRRASYVAEGVPPLPAHMTSWRTRVAPTVLALSPLAVADAQDEPELLPERELFRQMGTRSILLLPISLDGKLRGVLSAASVRERRDWAAGEVEFLGTAVRLLSAALRQTELVAELGRERDRLRVLFDLAQTIHRSATEEEVVEAALLGLRATLGFDTAGFSTLSLDGRTLVAAGGYGPPGIAEAYRRFGLEPDAQGRKPLPLQVVETGEPLVVEDLETDPRAAASLERLRAFGIRSVGLFPMRPGGRLTGLLAVGRDGVNRRIEPEDVATLQSLADFAGVALEQRRAAQAARASMQEALAMSEATRALLTRTASRDVLLGQVIDALFLHFGKESCRLLLVDAEKRRLVEWDRRGEWPGYAGEREMPLDGPGLTIAAAKGQIVNVPDVSLDARYVPGWPPARSELAVPLRIDGDVVGVFDLQSERLDAFGLDDVRAVSAFADRAALALRMADLVRQLEERTRVLESVARATQLLNFRLHTPDVLTAIVEETCRAFPVAEGAVAYVVAGEGKKLAIAAAAGLGIATQRSHGSEPVPMERLLCAGVSYRENRPVTLETTDLESLMAGDPPEVRARVRANVGGAEIRSLLAVPIRVAEQRLGVLELLAARPRAFSALDVETLVLLAEQAAIALRNARLVEELQRSNRLKEDFLANLSHEVRTPLTGIVGWAEVLLDARGEDPETKRALNAILGQAETLSRMLADLIDLSRIDTFGLEIRTTRVRLQEPIAAALESVSPAAAKRGVTVACDVDPKLPPVLGDPARLKQVLWNLLSNGIKFSPSGATVTLRAGLTGEGSLELCVADDGFGIDAAFLPFVFERFRQEETASNRRFGGLGIGLSIVKAVVEGHGASITVASDGRGKGARFTILFPPNRVAPPSGALGKSALRESGVFRPATAAGPPR